MKAGTHVEIIGGDHAGRYGVVQVVTVDGVAVRLHGADGWPFPKPVVVDRASLKRRPKLRRLPPASDEALVSWPASASSLV